MIICGAIDDRRLTIGDTGNETFLTDATATDFTSCRAVEDVTAGVGTTADIGGVGLAAFVVIGMVATCFGRIGVPATWLAGVTATRSVARLSTEPVGSITGGWTTTGGLSKAWQGSLH